MASTITVKDVQAAIEKYAEIDRKVARHLDSRGASRGMNLTSRVMRRYGIALPLRRIRASAPG